MKQKLRTAAGRVRSFLGSSLCWRLVVGLFVFEALWFVFSARYPMAFDENYHFGLIKLHAQQWLPYFSAQPDGAGVYGAIVRDPSYLYHWLMSLPYRLVAYYTHSQTVQVIILRLVNVAFFAFGLVLYRRIVRRLGASQALTNSLLAALVLLPVVPFLAATINYDNLFFVAVALTVLLTLKLDSGFTEKRIDAPVFLWLVAVTLLASLIKYPFLPLFAVTVVFLIIRLAQFRLLGLNGWRSFVRSFISLSILRRVVLVLLCLGALGLFVERYGTNIVTYHGPVPDCDAVISQDECAQYGPYGRDQYYKQLKPAHFHANVAVYSWEWLWGMWYRLYFAISDTYATAPPLLLIAWLGVVCAVLMLVGIMLRFRALFVEHAGRQFVLYLTIGYSLVLFVDGFSAYSKTGQPVAVNGRYLIPFLPFMLVLGGLAWSQLLRRRPNIKVAAAGLVLGVMLLQGGGAMTFIIRSSDEWLWPNRTVRTVNHTVRSAAWSFMLGRGHY
jgi:hypothetical protein